MLSCRVMNTCHVMPSYHVMISCRIMNTCHAQLSCIVQTTDGSHRIYIFKNLMFRSNYFELFSLCCTEPVLSLPLLSGLEAQLLGIVVKKERPELEEQKGMLVRNIAGGKKKIQQLEDEILRFVFPPPRNNCDNQSLLEVSSLIYVLIATCFVEVFFIDY